MEPSASAETEQHELTFEELLQFAPQWCLFWAGSVSESQFAIWRPYVARSRYRFLVVARKGTANDVVRSWIAELPNCRLMIANDESIRALKQTKGLYGFLYVLGFKTATFSNVNTFRNHAHVWIAHGESEKLSSAPRSASIYDSVFVARYKGLGRFPRAIRPWVSRNACAIGAPMVEGIEPDPWTRPRPIRTILYAPTWEGYTESTNYSSLNEAGRRLVELLPALTERGVRVVLRPHPKAKGNRSGLAEISAQILAAGAVSGTDKAADFREADVMVSDVSGVTAEWLLTEKPSIMPVSDRLTSIDRSPKRLRREYPWMYQWDPARKDLFALLTQIEREDPLRAARRSAAHSMYRGHRSLDEASRTFDLALSSIRFGKTVLPIRWAFEIQRIPGVVALRTMIRTLKSRLAIRRTSRQARVRRPTA